MNAQRAQEIAESATMVDVTYDGKPIYIQHVDAENETARIYPLDQPNQEITISLNSLTEASPFQSDGIHMVCDRRD
ncbi:small acid-soluble spore protein H [Paenibacillus sp. OV219]|uniref:small acid-soluble spore protein H n=1 Tax=Paenibacillus sp. OV219 TaxID=1884377 RepID=UPI0008B7EAFF|nr:small acid-soluble spore protein H [Paenibacillus sp. OV219]SEO60454.1 small acid-soluble spore protein H (minor) [Paenibacillus sp. OV219]